MLSGGKHTSYDIQAVFFVILQVVIMYNTNCVKSCPFFPIKNAECSSLVLNYLESHNTLTPSQINYFVQRQPLITPDTEEGFAAFDVVHVGFNEKEERQWLTRKFTLQRCNKLVECVRTKTDI